MPNNEKLKSQICNIIQYICDLHKLPVKMQGNEFEEGGPEYDAELKNNKNLKNT